MQALITPFLHLLASGPPARLHLVHRFEASFMAIWPVPPTPGVSVGPTGQATFGTPLRGLLYGHPVGPPAGSGPIQRALLNDPNVPYDQNTKKHEHLGQAEQRELPVDDGPREKKNSFNVENDEKNRNDVI